MHVGLGLLTLFPGRVGGSESNVRGLLGQFAAGNGPERVTVLANRHVMEAYGEHERGPVSLHHVRSYRPGDAMATRALAMALARAFPRRAARDVPAGLDVLHLPVTVPIPRLRVPTAVSVYDVQHHELPALFSRAERAFRTWAYDGAARSADLVITTSEYSRERLVELVGAAPERVEVVYLGIDLQRFTPEPGPDDERLLAGLHPPQRFLVYPANMWPHKNHERLVAALARVADPELALLLTGQDYGGKARLLDQARRLDVADRVRHLGFLPRDAVPALFRRATAMVFPSLYEGFGAPPLEAMACGCPVASSTRASLAEMCGDAVVPLEPEDPDSIAQAIESVTGDGELRARLRRDGPARAARFTWEAAARRHRQLYQRIAAA